MADDYQENLRSVSRSVPHGTYRSGSPTDA